MNLSEWRMILSDVVAVDIIIAIMLWSRPHALLFWRYVYYVYKSAWYLLGSIFLFFFCIPSQAKMWIYFRYTKSAYDNVQLVFCVQSVLQYLYLYTINCTKLLTRLHFSTLKVLITLIISCCRAGNKSTVLYVHGKLLLLFVLFNHPGGTESHKMQSW